jgi:hypothetical protein
MERKEMKELIKKILKEEFKNDFEWIQDNSIGGEELSKLIIQTKATSIPFEIVFGDLYLYRTKIKDLGDLKSVGGYLDLEETSIESLGNLESVGGYLNLRGTPIESLGNLKSVGGDLYLEGTPIQDLGNLKNVGGDLELSGTPISKKYSEEKIRQMVHVGGHIHL